MISIYKRGKKWRAQVRIDGKSKSKTLETRSEAVRWADDTEHDLKTGQIILQGKTLDDAFDRYLEDYTMKKKGWKAESKRIQFFKKQKLASIMLSSLDTRDLEDFINTRRVQSEISDATVLRELNIIRSVLRKCREKWKWMKHNPFEGIELPRRPQPRYRRIDQDEINRVLQALNYTPDALYRGSAWENGHAFLIALETALRRGEIWSLTWENVFLEQRYVHLPDTKNEDARDVPLSKRAVELFEALGPKSSGKLFLSPYNSAEAIWRKKIKKAGITDLHFHDTRHEAVTRLAKKVEVMDLAKIIGHRDIKSLMIYYNPTVSELADMLD